MKEETDGEPAHENGEEKEENRRDRILQSNACRRLFSFSLEKGAFGLQEDTDEMREEQKHRWNFDFMTETPLPGRYQWVRTVPENGHQKNGTEGPQRKRPLSENSTEDMKQTSATQEYIHSERKRTQAEDPERTEPTGSCDTTLNNTHGSGRSLRWNEAHYDVDWN